MLLSSPYENGDCPYGLSQGRISYWGRGMDHSEIDKLALVTADVLTAIGNMIDGGSIVDLFAVYPDIGLIQSEDWTKAKEQLKALSMDDRKAVEDIFNKNLGLKNKGLEVKIQSGVGILEEAIELVESAVLSYKNILSLYVELKALFV